jgi:predicted ATP-grasp superfamily ATP-dependent carboligase/protein-tyrosine-phosphatase
MPAAAAGSAGPRTLVLDGDQGSALAVVRSLGRRGIAVDVASDQAEPIAARSRFAGRTLRYPDPLADEQAFVAWLSDVLTQEPYALVIPVTERSLVPLLRLYRGPRRECIAMAPEAALDQVLDKDRTMQLAASLDVPVPRSAEITSMDGIDDVAAGLGWPVVVKPARSVGQGDAGRVQLSVRYAFDSRSLHAAARHALRFGSVLLQEYFRGDGVGIELIADKGTVRYAFQHRRLHEVPLTGGGSSLRICEAVNPTLLQATTRLIQALAWHGVAMVEFKWQPQTGDFRLMEINGRFWGSLPLAVAAGADFPAMLQELWTTQAVGEHPPARVGTVCRHLGRDLDWLEHVLRKAAPPALVQLPGWRRVAADSLLMFSPRHHFDIQSFSDPRPGLTDLRRIAVRQWDRIRGALQRRRFLAAQFKDAQAGGDGARILAKARHVLFLCHGNINRSAVAQVYAESRYARRFDYRSAGFHPVQGRPADPTMVDQAATLQLDLHDWSSHTLQAQQLEQADVVFVMEQAHVERLLSSHPQLAGRVFLLGASAARHAGESEIPDPYGLAPEKYAAVLQQVTRAIDGWMRLADDARAQA